MQATPENLQVMAGMLEQMMKDPASLSSLSSLLGRAPVR